MGVCELTCISLYVLLCLLLAILLVRISERRKHRTRLNKAPVRLVEIPAEDEITSLKDAYNLDWKPERNTHEPLPETMTELAESSKGFSPLVTELMHRLNVPEASAKDVAYLIASDQGLTSFVLQRANSPFYGLVQ